MALKLGGGKDEFDTPTLAGPLGGFNVGNPPTVPPDPSPTFPVPPWAPAPSVAPPGAPIAPSPPPLPGLPPPLGKVTGLPGGPHRMPPGATPGPAAEVFPFAQEFPDPGPGQTGTPSGSPISGSLQGNPAASALNIAGLLSSLAGIPTGGVLSVPGLVSGFAGPTVTIGGFNTGLPGFNVATPGITNVDLTHPGLNPGQTLGNTIGPNAVGIPGLTPGSLTAFNATELGPAAIEGLVGPNVDLSTLGEGVAAPGVPADISEASDSTSGGGQEAMHRGGFVKGKNPRRAGENVKKTLQEGEYVVSRPRVAQIRKGMGVR